MLNLSLIAQNDDNILITLLYKQSLIHSFFFHPIWLLVKIVYLVKVMIRLRKFTDIFSLWCIEGHAWGRVSIQLEKLYLPNKPNRNLYLVYWQKSLLLYIINIEWRIYWVSACSFRKQFSFFLSSAELWKLWWCSVFMCSLCLNSEQFLKIVYTIFR